MKRRDVLKGMAVGVVAAALPSASEAREVGVRPAMSVRQLAGGSPYRMALEVYPKEGKFAPGFQEAVEHWEGYYGEHLRAVGPMEFEPLMDDGKPWLIHPAWEPRDPNQLSTLYTEGANVFRVRRWPIIDRAVNLREHGYWRQEYGPQFMNEAPAVPSPGFSHLRMFRRVVRARLDHIQVRFEAMPLADIERYSGGEYGQLELELLALKDLYEADKLTGMAYLKCCHERWNRLGELETGARKA
jgi:hypothetical protein